MPRFPRRPRTKRGVLTLVAGALVVVVAAVAVVYLVAFPTSSPDSFAIAPSTATSGSADTADSSGGVAGSWTVAAGTQAGYRVREKLAFLPAKNDAVGRTSDVTGTATLATSGSTVRVTAAAFKIDVSTLTSDRSMRDQRIHEIGIESDRYPTVTFKLTKPLTVPAGAQDGGTAKVAATGIFTIHGTARQQTVPLTIKLSGSSLEAVGSLTFPWGRFGMTAPSVGGFVSVEPEATMEFDLRLAKKA